LKEIQQFETVLRNECTKPIWQSHVKNTITILNFFRNPHTHLTNIPKDLSVTT
jgi:hypothetical protein